MSRRHSIVICAAASLALLTASTRAGARADEPETVIVTWRVKAGAEAEAQAILARHWETARRLNLVRESPHVTLRTSDAAGKTFVEIFTWRDAAIPDAAPAEIRAIWDDMNKIAEPRGGRPGLEIAMAEIVSPSRP
jgi:hypothetical protein